MDLPDNGAHVGAYADPSNDLVNLTFGTGVKVFVEFFKDFIFVFNLF